MANIFFLPFFFFSKVMLKKHLLEIIKLVKIYLISFKVRFLLFHFTDNMKVRRKKKEREKLIRWILDYNSEVVFHISPVKGIWNFLHKPNSSIFNKVHKFCTSPLISMLVKSKEVY